MSGIANIVLNKINSLDDIIRAINNFTITTLKGIRYIILIYLIIYFLYKTIEYIDFNERDKIFSLSVKCLGGYILWLIFELFSITYIF